MEFVTNGLNSQRVTQPTTKMVSWSILYKYDCPDGLHFNLRDYDVDAKVLEQVYHQAVDAANAMVSRYHSLAANDQTNFIRDIHNELVKAMRQYKNTQDITLTDFAHLAACIGFLAVTDEIVEDDCNGWCYSMIPAEFA